MADTVDKVGQRPRSRNNRIHIGFIANHCCAVRSSHESILLGRLLQNVYQHNRHEADPVTSRANVRLRGVKRTSASAILAILMSQNGP
jgi:hypothetical protein